MASDHKFSPDSVVTGTSPRMQAVFDLVHTVADSNGTVLITGESGTGKEVVANLIHHQSRRRSRPFLPVSCAILSDTLIESELFGHERGAFTGAIKDRPGRFELAEGGTIFLDDIDDVPLLMQVKLLRVLQNRSVERVGAVRSIPVDVRVVAGSKRDLKELVAQGKFRDDLYYRLSVLPVVLPPLRERRGDIPDLMDHFFTRFFRQRGERVPPITPAIRAAFMSYSWPGNIRELENLCERIALTCGGCLDAGCLPTSLLQVSGANSEAGPIEVEPAPAVHVLADDETLFVSLDDRLHEVEANLISWALRVTNGNKSRAAQLLKIKRSTLGDRINRCGLGTSSAAPADEVLRELHLATA
jgi:transcriptional regulator with GAF, ATPase, and Fis domain